MRFGRREQSRRVDPLETIEQKPGGQFVPNVVLGKWRVAVSQRAAVSPCPGLGHNSTPVVSPRDQVRYPPFHAPRTPGSPDDMAKTVAFVPVVFLGPVLLTMDALSDVMSFNLFQYYPLKTMSFLRIIQSRSAATCSRHFSMSPSASLKQAAVERSSQALATDGGRSVTFQAAGQAARGWPVSALPAPRDSVRFCG